MSLTVLQMSLLLEAYGENVAGDFMGSGHWGKNCCKADLLFWGPAANVS